MADDATLVEVADGCHAHLAPAGTWGLSNAGLVVGEEGALLVDTLFDLDLTGRMLDGMAAVLGGRGIDTVVNTHANGDHCYGNQLVADATIVTSAATEAEMGDVPPEMMAAMADLEGPLGETFRRYFGRFDFSGITLPPVDETFTGERRVEVGGTAVDLFEVGPAHTAGDTIAWVPDRGVVFTGDICFIGSTPIVWAGPVANWIAACDRIVALDPEVVVPGHGPLTDTDGVREVAAYLAMVEEEATARHEAGMSVTEAAADIALGPFGDWGETGRLVANVEAVYRDLDVGHDPMAVTDLFVEMAAYEDAGLSQTNV